VGSASSCGGEISEGKLEHTRVRNSKGVPHDTQTKAARVHLIRPGAFYGALVITPAKS
jgi:hypothetical protein